MVWLRDYPRPAVSSQRTYRYAVERIDADAGDVLLARLDRPTARRLAKEWPTGTTRVARTMFADAHRDGLITANPFTNLRLETPKGRKDLDALTETDIAQLADAAVSALGKYGREFRAILIFLGYVGCRPGSSAASGAPMSTTISLRSQSGSRSTVRAAKAAEERPTARRDDPTHPLAALADVPIRLDSPYLFRTTSGRRLSKGMLSYSFRVVRQRWAKREHLELYELRHACATLLMERGLPPHVVANQLGHTDGGARSCSASTGIPQSAACASRSASHSENGMQMGCSRLRSALETEGFRSDSDPPSPP